MSHYVLITPAKNEADFLPNLINSIKLQIIRPVQWIIVSDGSTDATDKIVEDASQSSHFLKLIRVDGHGKRSFGSKALAFQEGYKALQNTRYDFIGNLDADVTFGKDYYKRVIEEMNKNPRLGVAGGVIWDKSGNGFKMVTSNFFHAVGAVQFWRRECFEAVGGYKPATIGGIDSLAEFTARMKGWETQSFPDLPVYHHKPVDSANAKTGIKIAYRAGMTEYHIGTDPVFALLKAIRRWGEKPTVISIFFRLYGYGRLWIARTKRDAPDELVAYLRKERKRLLLEKLRGKTVYNCPTWR